MKEEIFWELQKKYNLLLDNENYDDLEKFAVECVKMGREEMRQECLAAVPEEYGEVQMEMAATSELYEQRKGHNMCRELTITNIKNIK